MTPKPGIKKRQHGFMPGKSALTLWLLALGLLFSIVVGTAAAEPQNPAGYHIFGLTIEDIYDWGVMITDVDVGSRARQIGLKKDDVILAINGEPVLGTYEFLRLVQELGGGPVRLTVSRVGQIGTFIIDLADHP
jgi:S1-C subfamily serine protease